MRLRDVMSRYRAVYRTITGGKFFGHLLAGPKLDNPNRMEQPRMFMEVHPDVRNVAAGTIVVINGRNYLACDNADSDRDELVARTFKLIRVNQFLEWKRQDCITDPVTGLKRSYDNAPSKGFIWCSVEPDRELNDSTNIQSEQYTLYTNAALETGDTVGPYTVTWVDQLLGVTAAKVKK